MESLSEEAGPARVRLAHRDEIPVNSAKRVCFGRRVIAIFNLDGAFYATDDTCTHGPASLAEEGLLEGDFVECSLHGGIFHIPTGKPVKLPPIAALGTYRVEIEADGDLYVRIASSL